MRFILWFMIFACCSTGLFADSVSETITVNSEQRRFLVVSPVTKNRPVLIVLHGGGGKPEWAAYRSGDFGLANWAVVYPAAMGKRRWNDGRRGADGAEIGKTADFEFLNAMIDRLIDQGANPHKIFVAGDSNGGMMTLRMICQAGGRLAGAAVLIGNQPVGLACPYQAPVPLLFFHGTKDEVTPFAGGEVAKSGAQLGNIKSVEDTLNLAAGRNDCDGYTERQQDDPNPNDSTSVRFRQYQGCSRPLLHYIVDGGGHSWPGHPHEDPKIEKRFGPTTQDIDADELIAEFFTDLAAD